MKTKLFLGLLLALAAVALLTGCGTSSPPATAHADEVPVVAQADDEVVAEAVVEPVKWNEAAFASGGTVAEVLVAEGDVVEEGQLLVRLDAAQQESAVAQAEAGLHRAQARLDELKAGPRPQEIEAAQAAIEGAQAQLDRIRQGVKPAEIAAAEASLGVAQASLEKVLEGASEEALIAARADLANAEAALQQAQAAYDRVKSEPDIGARPEALALQQATHAYEAARARLNELKKGATAADIAIARAQVQQAQAQIDALKAPAQSADIAAAQAEIHGAEAQLALLEAGVRPETIAAAEADVAAAQAALNQAKTALADMKMHAPLAGVVTGVQVEIGDQVGPGQALVVIATLDQFYVRTIDLVELDVARVTVGQPVVVTVDAFPDREFQGMIHEIALQAKDYRGDVVYDVTVELTDPELSEALRWGMTAMVRIQTD
jgi:HlyD family secretion protein